MSDSWKHWKEWKTSLIALWLVPLFMVITTTEMMSGSSTPQCIFAWGKARKADFRGSHQLLIASQWWCWQQQCVLDSSIILQFTVPYCNIYDVCVCGCGCVFQLTYSGWTDKKKHALFTKTREAAMWFVVVVVLTLVFVDCNILLQYLKATTQLYNPKTCLSSLVVKSWLIKTYSNLNVLQNISKY